MRNCASLMFESVAGFLYRLIASQISLRISFNFLICSETVLYIVMVEGPGCTLNGEKIRAKVQKRQKVEDIRGNETNTSVSNLTYICYQSAVMSCVIDVYSFYLHLVSWQQLELFSEYYGMWVYRSGDFGKRDVHVFWLQSFKVRISSLQSISCKSSSCLVICLDQMMSTRWRIELTNFQEHCLIYENIYIMNI